MWHMVCISWCFKSRDFTMPAILGGNNLLIVELLQNVPHCLVNFVLFVCLTCMCFLRAVCLRVFSCVYTCPMGE